MLACLETNLPLFLYSRPQSNKVCTLTLVGHWPPGVPGACWLDPDKHMTSGGTGPYSHPFSGGAGISSLFNGLQGKEHEDLGVKRTKFTFLLHHSLVQPWPSHLCPIGFPFLIFTMGIKITALSYSQNHLKIKMKSNNVFSRLYFFKCYRPLSFSNQFIIEIQSQPELTTFPVLVSNFLQNTYK